MLLPPRITLNGRLELVGENWAGFAEVIKGSLTPDRRHLPEFDYAFVQVDDYMVPVRRGLLITAQVTYDLILEPGRIWLEPGDQGWSRVSLPFSLVFKGDNGLLSGTLTFLVRRRTSFQGLVPNHAGDHHQNQGQPVGIAGC